MCLCVTAFQLVHFQTAYHIERRTTDIGAVFGASLAGLRFYSCFRTSKLFLQLPITPPTVLISVFLLECVLLSSRVSVVTHKSRCEISVAI